jgi:hypothetical protein
VFHRVAVFFYLCVAAGAFSTNAKALSIPSCGYSSIGSASTSGNGTSDSFDLRDNASCDVDISNVAEASGVSFFGATASADARSVLQASWSIENGSFVLLGFGLSSASALSNGVQISPAPTYDTISAISSAQNQFSQDIALASGDAFAYTLEVTVQGSASNAVYFGGSGEFFRGSGSVAEHFFRSGLIGDPNGDQGFGFNIVAASDAAAFASPDGGVSDAASESTGVFEYRLSLTPVPLPAGAWLLLSGIAGLANLLRKTRNERSRLASQADLSRPRNAESGWR